MSLGEFSNVFLAKKSEQAKEYLRLKDLKRQKRLASPFSCSMKTVSLVTCLLMLSMVGLLYPFNMFERVLEVELGVIPTNIQFLTGVGFAAYFLSSGFYGIVYDRFSFSC